MQSNYLRQWLRRKGMRMIEYVNANARRKGFKNQTDYINTRYQLKGFKDKPDYERFKRLRKRYHKSVSDFVVREKQLRREVEARVKRELQEFVLIRRSMRGTKCMKKELRRKSEDNEAIPAQVG